MSSLSPRAMVSVRNWMLRPAVSSALVFGIALLATTGCYKTGDQGSAKKPAESHEHDHPTVGPHKGSLIELGVEEYHAELVHDDDAHKVTIYLFDGHVKDKVTSSDATIPLNFVVDGKPVQYALKAAPQAGDAAGASSRFELVDEALCKAIDDEKAKGKLNVTLGGKSYSGELKHDHGHDHDHGHKH